MIRKKTSPMKAGRKDGNLSNPGRTNNIAANLQMEFVASIKEKRQLKEDLRRVEQILASIYEAVIIASSDGTIIVANPASELITASPPHMLVGKNVEEALKFSCADGGGSRFIKESLEGWRVVESPANCQLVRADGKLLPVSAVASPLYTDQGAYAGIVLVVIDRTKEVEIAKHQEELLRLKDEFVALASHQLRSPPSIVNWYSEVLLSGEIGELNEKQKRYINEIYDANIRMIGLVNDFLNVSRIESGSFSINPEQTSLSAVMDAVLEELKPLISKKKTLITKRCSKDLILINADQKLLRIVFLNLVSNAVKYTPPEGKVYITIKKDGQNILIEVKDNGYGIPKNQYAKVFTKLFRGDNIRKKEPDGTGLGLYLVKAVVEQVGGAVSFESEENSGTTFHVTIPLSGMKRKEGTTTLA